MQELNSIFTLNHEEFDKLQTLILDSSQSGQALPNIMPGLYVVPTGMFSAKTGTLGGAVVIAVFAVWLGTNNTSQLLFGLEQPYLFVVIPILGAGVAGFWASGAPVTEFGPLRGAFLGALALLSVVAVLGLFRGSSLVDSMMFILVFMFFGFIFVGWAAMLLGAFTGWLFKQHIKAHSDNQLVRTPGTTRHVS